jgi:hypothetical protein
MKLRIFSENSEVPANSFIAGLLCALQNGSSFYSHTAAESERQFLDDLEKSGGCR